MSRLLEVLEGHIEQGCPVDSPALKALENRKSVPEFVLDGAAMAGLVARLGRLDSSLLAERMGLNDHDLKRIGMGLEGLSRLAAAMERNGIGLGVWRLDQR